MTDPPPDAHSVNETSYAFVDSDQDTDEFEFVDNGNQQQPSDAVSCSSVSALSSVYEDEFVHDRRYHGYKKGRYPLPNDEIEQQREEMNHTMMVEIADGRLFFADIGNHPQKIIDIGTGTGLWVIDVADKFPSASVIGTDLSAIQPQWMPVNARMFVEDCEEEDWLHGTGFDLVHYRSVANLVKDFDSMLSRAYSHTKDGGWIEVQEILPRILCDDDSMLPDDPLRLLFEAAEQGLKKFGFKQYGLMDIQDALKRAGYTNVQCIRRKVPVSPWARDKHFRSLGTLMKANIVGILGALAAKPLAAIDVEEKDRRSLMKMARQSLDDNRVHRYVECCFCFAQKGQARPTTPLDSGI